MQELKEIKQILRVPRLHLKYQEKLEFESLVGMNKKAKTQGLVTPHTNTVTSVKERNAETGTFSQ